MNQTYFLIFGIVAIIVVATVILIGGIGSEGEGEKYVITENQIINKGISGAPFSPMDLVLIISQFSEDRTSEITAKIGKREGYPTEAVNWINTNAKINLSEGLELIEGNVNWQGDIVGDAQKEFKIKVRAVKSGEWVVEANAKYIIDETNWYGDVERLYILVKDDEVLISDRSFTPVSPREGAEPVIEEHEVCPQGYEWNDYREECILIEHGTCPDDYTWNSNLQKCVLSEHEECPGGYVWDEISQSCQRGEEPVSP